MSLISSWTSLKRRPMNRLIDETVFSGFVIAWRLAIWPTRISPSFVNATTDGVVRLPSWFGMTTGSLPSRTATTELVVPRSMPMTFAIASLHLSVSHDPAADFSSHLHRHHGEMVMRLSTDVMPGPDH